MAPVRQSTCHKFSHYTVLAAQCKLRAVQHIMILDSVDYLITAAFLGAIALLWIFESRDWCDQPFCKKRTFAACTLDALNWVCCTLYLGHLPNDFCVTSPTKLLHFPNNLLRFPNKIASFPQQLESLPQQLVSLPQHIFSFPQQLCVTLPPTKK